LTCGLIHSPAPDNTQNTSDTACQYGDDPDENIRQGITKGALIKPFDPELQLMERKGYLY
jgi:hypothetical protein